MNEENKREGWELLVVIFSICMVLFCMLNMVSCKTQQPQVVEKIVTNTEYVDRYKTDSIYIDKIKYIDRASDTIRIVEKDIEYRYRVLVDSVEVLRVDSIPYEVQVVEIIETMNNHQKTMYALGWIAVIGLVVRTGWKVYKKFKL